MRILFLTHRLPYAPNRGDRIRAWHLLRLLAARHEVHLVSLTHDREEASHIGDLAGLARSVAGAPVHRRRAMARAAASLGGPTPLTHVLLASPQMPAALRRVVHAGRPDVVVAYCTGVARYALEPPLAGIPWILDMVDVDSCKWAALGRTTAGPKGWVYRREARRLGAFERRAVAAAAATLVVSDRERAALEEVAPGANALVVPNGVDVAGFAPPGPPAEGRGVVFCGVFNYQPNEMAARWLAAEVWPLVRRAHPDATLTLVGMHPTAAVRALERDRSIRVTGGVPDVRPWLWKAAVSVAPLQVARGVQNKVLEALAAGLPCVVTPQVFDGLPEAARAGCRVASGAADFAAAVGAWLSRGGAERRQAAGLAGLASLGWDAQLAPVLRVIEEAGAGRSAAAQAPSGSPATES